MLIVFCCSCNALHNRPKEKGVYLRIVNIDTIKTDGYTIGEYNFPGLKPGHRSKYKFIGTFNWSHRIAVKIDSFTFGRSFTHCNTCEIDSPKYITLKIKIKDIEADAPDLDLEW